MFKYKALDKNGNIKTGELRADGRNDALHVLRGMNLSPVLLEEIKGKNRKISKKSISRKDILNFTNQIASMLGAKLPLITTLETLRDQTATETMRDMVAGLCSRVSQGATISEALSAYPKQFNGLYISVIRAGETGGLLSESFRQLAVMMEKDEKIRSKVKGAMTYPAVMLAVMVLSVSILMTFVVPKFSSVFSDMGTALPLSTRILISISNMFKDFWWLGALMAAAVMFAYKAYYQTENGRMQIDAFKLSLPVFGRLISEVIIARFCLTVGVLLQSGVTLLDSVTSSVPVAQNGVYEKALNTVISQIKAGEQLGSSMAKRDDVFPGLLTGMVSTGEKAGNLDEMFMSVGRFYEQESEERINNLTTLLEPVIILVMGVVVGAIIVAMLMPVFDMGSVVK